MVILDIMRKRVMVILSIYKVQSHSNSKAIRGDIVLVFLWILGGIKSW